MSTNRKLIGKSSTQTANLVGYPKGMKGYRFYDFDANKYVMSRDATFIENKFGCPEHLQETCDVFDEESDVEEDSEVMEITNVEHEGESLESLDKEDEDGNEDGTSVSSESYDGNSDDEYVPRQSSQQKRKASNELQQHQPRRRIFVLLASSITEPKTFTEAMRSDEANEWMRAMTEELESIERNGTWSLCSLPKGRKAIGVRWVFKRKLNSDGSIERYKARLVAKGYSQVPGIDFERQERFPTNAQ